MPAFKRYKTKYPGVFYIEGLSISGKPERIFYIRYRKDGKMVEEKAGRQFQDDMTPAKAAGIRANRVERKELSNAEQRHKGVEREMAEKNKPTIAKLWAEYKEAKPKLKGIITDQNRFQNHILPNLGNKTPEEILPLDIDRLRLKKLKGRSPATVRNTLELLRRIINFGIKRNRCAGLAFKLEMPEVNNETTETLSTDELSRLLVAIEQDEHAIAGKIMRMALYTGMRRGEIFKLRWNDINLEKGFIVLRDPKGKKDVHIPINDGARNLLMNHPRTQGSDYVFSGRNGQKRVCIKKAVNRIKKKAGIPDEFRALHGLRHVYATLLAESGKVDMLTLQKLMSHKSPQMTQRYAHIRDEALKKGADQIDEILNKVTEKKSNIVNMKG